MTTCTNFFRIVMSGVALLSAASANATLYVFDPVPTNGVSPYTNNMALTSQAPTNPAIIGEGTNMWGQGLTATSVLFSDGTGLVYGTHMAYPASGGAFAFRYSGLNADGRLLSRPVKGLPAGGSLYLSMLTKIEYKAIASLNSGMSLGMGLATNAPASSTPTAATIPSNGVYFGYYTNNATGLALVVNVAGTNCTLVVNPATNTTYLCVARIDIGAGPGGKDIIYAVANPATMPATQADYAVVVTNTVLNGSAFSQLSIGGGYHTGGYRVWFDEVRAGSSLQDVFAFDDLPLLAGPPTIVGSTDGTFAFSATLTNVTSDTVLLACYGATTGFGSASTWALSTPIAAPPTANVAATGALSTFATNTCYFSAAVATNGKNNVISYGPVFMTGEVWLTPNGDASESGQVSGGVVVHRPPVATQLPLTVYYTVSGTATPGSDYATNNLSGILMLPAGQDSATIAITPLINTATTSNTTVGITLAPGPYWIGADSNAAVTITNCAYNTWQGSAISSNASVAANWSLARVPLATDDILLDATSTSAIFWDAGVNGLSDTVSSWTQTSNYTGAVTFPVCYTNVAGATFTNFTVTGNATINGGSWTHPQSVTRTTGSALTVAQLRTAEVYRLCATIGGSLTVGAGGAIDASGKGYYHNAGINITPAHGGKFSSPSVSVYGDVAYPEEVGYPFNNGTDQAEKFAAGGGAILLRVGGTATINGTVNVNGQARGLATGAGGSLILQAPTVTGTGTLLAEGPAATNTTAVSGVGGRIAVLTTTPVDFGRLTLSASVVGRGTCGGCGTIYLRDATTPNGVIIVRDLKNPSTVNDLGMCTPVSTEGNWTFDRVVLGGVSRLTVPAGTTLTLSNGLGSVSSTNTATATSLYSGLFYQGGTLNLGPGATQVIQSNWVFAAISNFVINADVLITNGAAIGLPQIQQALGSYTPPTNCFGMDLKVAGNLTVASNAFISGSQAGAMIDDHYVPTGYEVGAHGGRNSLTGTNYDSILNPRLPGLGHQNSYSYLRSGAALKLEVTGTLTLNGTATVDECPSTPFLGGAGSMNLKLGALAGIGTISAKAPGSCAGGRIAVRLTGAGSTFDAFGITNIVATGPASTKGSAGTVYLQTAADGEGGGLIIVRNSASSSTNNTSIPANGASADAAADLRNASLSLSSSGRVDFASDLSLNALTAVAGTSLDLAGHTITVNGLTVAGKKYSGGVYTAAYFPTVVVDQSVGQKGRIIVKGGGTAILFR